MGLRRKLSLGLATLCLALSVWTVTQELIDYHNDTVRMEQIDRQTFADHGVMFSHDSRGIDYRERNRHLILYLCITGFFLCLSPRTVWFSPLNYALTLPLVYQWIAVTMRDLSFNDSYMADSPYLLRVATPFEWALFTVLIVASGVNVFVLVDHIRRRRR